MNDITALAQRMKAAALKATQGEWWSDVVEADGEYGDGEDRESGFHSYAVYDAQGRSLLDMTNSTAATIQTEWGHDNHSAWDVVGEHNTKHIIASQPQNVLALVEALEARDKQIVFLKEQLAQLANFNPDWDRLEAATDSLREHMAELNSAQARIAELESRTVTVRLPSGTGWASDPYNHGRNDGISECAKELRVAGIQVIEGEQKNG